MRKNDYVDTDSVQEMTREELKLYLNSIYGKQSTKKRAPEPRRRQDDIEPIDEMIISTAIFTCVMGVIFILLTIGGL